MNCIGVDIIEIGRVEQAISRQGQRFLKRIYTEKELASCKGRTPELAARFAAKEAVMKLLGTGFKGLRWTDIETLSNPDGKPIVFLSGGAQESAEKIGLKDLAISLSHSRDYAVASAVGTAD